MRRLCRAASVVPNSLYIIRRLHHFPSHIHPWLDFVHWCSCKFVSKQIQMCVVHKFIDQELQCVFSPRIAILDRWICARHTFEYTMYVFVLVGLWTHQFMTYDVMLLDQCLIDLLPLPAIHPHLFARDYRKKQPPIASPHVRSMHRPLFAHSPIFLLTHLGPHMIIHYLLIFPV